MPQLDITISQYQFSSLSLDLIDNALNDSGRKKSPTANDQPCSHYKDCQLRLQTTGATLKVGEHISSTDVTTWLKSLKQSPRQIIIIRNVNKPLSPEVLVSLAVNLAKSSNQLIILSISKEGPELNSITYRIRQQLQLIHDSGSRFWEQLFFVSERKITQRTKLFKLSKLPSATSGILRTFLPIFTVTKGNFDRLFKQQLHESTPHQRLERFIYQRIKEITAPLLEDDNVDHGFIQQHILNKPLLESYITSSLLSFYALEKAKTKSIGKVWLKHAKKILRSEMHSIQETCRFFMQGLFEITENSILHTNESECLISISYALTERLDGINLASNASIPKCYSRKHKDDTRHLHAFVCDFGKEGIVNSYIQKVQQAEAHKNRTVQLKDFYEGHIDLDEEYSHLPWRYLGHLGLRTFYNLINFRGGIFHANTRSHRKGYRTYYTSIGEESKSNEMLTKCRTPGTQYSIVLPILHIPENEFVPRSGLVDSDRSLDQFTHMLNNDGAELEVIDTSRFPDYETESNITRINLIQEFGNRIERQIKGYDKKFWAIDYFSFIDKGADLSFILKTLAYVQTLATKSNIIVFNTPPDIIRDQILIKLSSLRGHGTFWSKHASVYFYDQEGVPFIITGATAEACNAINKRVQLHCGKYYELLLSEETGEPLETDDLLKMHPFEVALPYKSGANRTIFEESARKSLLKSTTGDSFGLSLSDTHMRLGSKIHLSNFYEASALFAQSYYSDRFAYIIAQKILHSEKPIKHKKDLIICGYGSYAAMFLNNIRLYLENCSYSSFFNVRSITCEDSECKIWRGLDQLTPSLDPKKTTYHFIVPIASTLSTTRKIVDAFLAKAETRSFYPVDIYKRSTFQTVVLVRDHCKPTPSQLEQIYDWKEVSPENRTVKLQSDPQSVSYCIEVAGDWNHPLTCSKCHPSELPNEQYLHTTNKDSIVPKVNLGLPDAGVLPITNTKGAPNLKSLQDFVKCGHLGRNQHHFRFYIDTDLYFKDPKNNREIVKWLKTQVRSGLIEKSEHNTLHGYHVIVTTLHYSNSDFIKTVNEIVFSGQAIIIQFDPENDTRANITSKYNFLNHVKTEVSIHFVDDAIISGDTLDTSKSLINSIFTHNGHGPTFDSVIILANRLSQHRATELLSLKPQSKSNRSKAHTHFYAYLSICVPPVKMLKGKCWMCDLKNEYLTLAKSSTSNNLSDVFLQRYDSLSQHHERDEINFSRDGFNQLETLNRISPKLASICEQRSDDELYRSVDKLLYEELSNCTDLARKINFVSSIATPPTTDYYSLIQPIFRLLLKELDGQLNKTEKDLEILDIQYLRILIDNLSKLRSNSLYQPNIIISVFRVHTKFSKKFYAELKNIEQIDSENLSGEIFDYIRARDSYEALADLKGSSGMAQEIEDVYRLKKEQLYNSINSDLEATLHHSHPLNQLYESCSNDLFTATSETIKNFRFHYLAAIKQATSEGLNKCLFLEHILKSGLTPPPDLSDFILKRRLPQLGLLTDVADEDCNKEFEIFLELLFNENTSILEKSLEYLSERYRNQASAKSSDGKPSTSNGIPSLKTFFSDAASNDSFIKLNLVKFLPKDFYNTFWETLELKLYLDGLQKEGQGLTSLKASISAIIEHCQKIADADGCHLLLAKRAGLSQLSKISDQQHSDALDYDLYTLGRSGKADPEIPPIIRRTNSNDFSDIIHNHIREGNNISTQSSLANSPKTRQTVATLSLPKPTQSIHKNQTAVLVFTYSEHGDKDQIASIKERLRIIQTTRRDLQKFISSTAVQNSYLELIERQTIDENDLHIFQKAYHESYRAINNIHNYTKELTRGKNLSGIQVGIDAEAKIIASGITVGQMYTEIFSGKNYTTNQTSTTYEDVFDPTTCKLIEAALKNRDIKVSFPRISDKQRKCLIPKKHLTAFIFEIVNNSRKQSVGDNRELKISCEKGCLVFRTIGCECSLTSEELGEIANSDSFREIYNLNGIGLYVMSHYFRSNLNRHIYLSYNKPIQTFTTKLPVFE